MNFSTGPLEFDRLKALLGRYVPGAAARSLLEELTPSSDREALESRHARVREAMEYLRDRTLGFPDIAALPSALERLGPGGVTLEIPEIEAVQEFLADIVALKAGWEDLRQPFPLLGREVGALPDLTALSRLLGRAVRSGEIDEDFSPELRRLRRGLETARDRLNRKLQTMLRSAERSGQLQDTIVTVRNGRFVIPVRVEQQRNVPGIVHGSSSSGATVFMEPLETLEMNNDLVRLREEEEREVRRVLGLLTDAIQERREEIGRAVSVRAGLELVFGLARWGREFDCVTPRFSEDEVRLKRARHPLLDDQLRRVGESIVPLDLEMDPDERVLVISGPNAGGKTVVLKTLGLFALMAQSGIPVPASEASLPVMTRILADIGDQQSITNQLSTFSAHVLEISRMVEASGPGSLILLDEIGASTEPAEGAALGIAVLEFFRKAGSLAVATTHYNRLKMYAEATPGVRNAAMEFNEETLEPTYALVPGLAGQSSGLKIAERLNLNKIILEDARSRLDRSEIDAARFVERLKARIAELEEDRAVLETERRRFERWQRDMEREIEAERANRLRALEVRLDELVAGIRRSAQDSLRGAAGGTVRRFDRTLERHREDARRALRSEVEKERPAAAAGPERLRAGVRVRIRSLGVEGIVLEVRGGEALVSVGAMKAEHAFEELDVIGDAGPRLPERVHFDLSGKEAAPNELNVIGCSGEEARERVDKFLDDAVLGGLPSVRIIHGFGKGVLRKTIAELLGSHPHVAEFGAAPSEQGGGGVTVVVLKD